MKKTLFLFFVLYILFSCIYADTNPPDPQKLNTKSKKIKITARGLTKLAGVSLRVWPASQTNDIINIPLSMNHVIDSYQTYLNIISLPKKNLCLFFLDIFRY